MKKLIAIIFFLGTLSALAQMEPVRVKDKWGYKDHKTGKTIPIIYDEVNEFKGEEALVKKANKCLLINKLGKQLAEFPYPGVRYFKEGQYMFQGDTIWGIVSSTGQLIARMDFSELHKNGVLDNIYVAKKDNKVGIFSTTEGQILPMEYECEEFWKVFCRDGDLYFKETSPLTLKHNGKWGVMEMRGKIILPFDYDHLKPVAGYLEQPKGFLGATKNGKCGLIDYQGKEQIPFDYDFFLGQYQNREQSAADPYVFMKNGKVVLYDLPAKSVIPKVAPGVESYSRSECCVLSKGDKKGVIDTAGNIIVPFEYDFIEFGGGVLFENQTWTTCRVVNGKTCALYVPGVGLKTPFLEGRSLEYGKAYDKYFYIKNKGDECALLDSEFKLVLKVDFKNFSFSHNKIIIFDMDGRSGVVALDGTITWDPK